MLANKKDGKHLQASEDEIYAACCFGSLATLYPNITHELRGKLSNIVLHLELLREMQDNGAPDDEPNRERSMAEVALREVYTFNRALECLLELMQPMQEARRVFNLVQVLDDLSILAEAQAKRQRITLTFELSSDPQPFNGNVVEIRQALINLILLVMADIPPAGSMLIQAGRVDDQLQVVIQEGPRSATLEVKKSFMDPPPVLAEQRHLSLFVAQSIIAKHSGSLQVATAAEASPVVRLSLPPSPEAPTT